MKSLALGLALTCAATFTAAAPAGLEEILLRMPHHAADARVSIWYPSDGGVAPVVHAENPVFQGVMAAPDAPIRSGTYPVVMFSHGMGGTSRAQAWLASDLAERGAIVVAVNHPNSTWGNFDMTKGVNHWTRAQDLQVALDALLENPTYSGYIDQARIMAAGFSYGGWTALSLGGVRGNHAGLVDACRKHIDAMEVCGMLLSNPVNLQDIAAKAWNGDYADPRITHVAAIDPGFVWGLDASDTADLLPNTVLIGFGGEDDRMMDTNFDLSGLSDMLGDVPTKVFTPSFHFTAMPICKPAGEEILREERDDPVCTDPEGTDRLKVHGEIVDLIAAQLGL